jgi:tetratricopeptide (TPR) repeat protein
MSTSAGTFSHGCARYAAGDFARALHAFERHLDAHPRDANAWAAKAMTLWRLGRLDEANAARERARSLMPSDARALCVDCTAPPLGQGAGAAPPREPHPLVEFLGELAFALLEGLV